MTKTFETGGDSFTIYRSHGLVADFIKNTSTQVYGSGGGGYTYNGTGGSAPISISSTTHFHDKIFLDHGNGQQSLIELDDWDIAATKGHEMLILWIIKNNAERGPYVYVKNFTTGQNLIGNNVIDQLAEKPENIFKQNGGCAAITLIVFVGFAFGAIIFSFFSVVSEAFASFLSFIAFFVPGVLYYFWFKTKNIKYKEKQRVIRHNIDEFLKNYRG